MKRRMDVCEDWEGGDRVDGCEEEDDGEDETHGMYVD